MFAPRPSALAALLCLAAGCSPGPEVYPVTGTVTYDGKPLPAGQIFFEADVQKGRCAPQGFAEVKDGHFDTAKGGRGVIGGPYVIRIQGFDGKPNEELALGKPLFSDYIESRDIPKGPAQLEFSVPSAGIK
jgi:hypothetical protein